MTDAFEAAKPRYDALIVKHPGVERKGAKSAYTSMNGNMFSFLTEDGGLALRLGAKEREQFMAQHGLQLSVQYGTVMKEYVQIPPKLLANSRIMSRVFAQSVEYAKDLKPKATTRKKSAKQSPASQPTGKQQAAKRKSAKKKSAQRKSSRKSAT